MTYKQLHDERKRRGETQRGLAVWLGVSGNTVARWERDEVPIPQWVGRMFALRIEIEQLQRGVKATSVEADRKRASTRKRP